MYFDDDDLAAIHTLACAAREIYEKHCAAQGLERMFELIASAHPERSAKELWDIINGPRNFLKHPETSMDLSAELELDDGMNATMLWVACHDCALLCRATQPPEVQAFNLWFVVTRFSLIDRNDPNEEGVTNLTDAIERNYPSLRTAPLAIQKRIGKTMVHDAREAAAVNG
jgi:hypothetical protein